MKYDREDYSIFDGPNQVYSLIFLNALKGAVMAMNVIINHTYLLGHKTHTFNDRIVGALLLGIEEIQNVLEETNA